VEGKLVDADAVGVESPPDARSIEAWIGRRLAELIGDDSVRVNANKPIAAYGVDSVEAAALTSELESWLGRPLPQNLVWEWASTRELAQRVARMLRAEALAGEPSGTT